MKQPSDIAARVIADLRFDANGLVPAIAQEAETGEVLMLAYMNADAIRETLKTGQICYWSRSRQALWHKGESSGHIQRLVELRYDCDNDAVLVRVDQTGPACHTNRPNCFFNAVRDGEVVVISDASEAHSTAACGYDAFSARPHWPAPPLYVIFLSERPRRT